MRGSKAIRGLLWLAAATSLLLLIRQLHASGDLRALGRRAFIYEPAVFFGLCLAGLGYLRGRAGAPLAAAGLSLVLYLANERLIPSGDTRGGAFVAFALVRHGTVSLDEVAPPPPYPYAITEHRGRLWPTYPIGAALAALPLFTPVALGNNRPGESPHAEKLAAAALSAASVGFLLAALLAIPISFPFAAAITLLYAAGSSMLSTSSQALWQHGPAALALTIALWSLICARTDPRFFTAAGAAAGFAVLCRPTNILLAAGLALIALKQNRAAALRFAAGFAPLLLLLAAYHTAAFGAPWRTGYGESAARFRAPVIESIFGIPFSPTRGLFTFVPWAAFACVGFWRGRRQLLYAATGLAAAATTILFMCWQQWWGGYCYGPRLVADTMPLLALGLAPLDGWLARRGQIALVVTGAIAIALHTHGAYRSKDPDVSLVYDVSSESEALQWSRYPPLQPFLRR